MQAMIQAFRKNLQLIIRGKNDRIDKLLTAFLAGGNVLLNDVPGVGKTTIAKAIAISIGGIFHRIQFTPDLLPADILGGSIYNPREGTFAFRQGPVFANVLLADEINRASPRTQSSLLEAMAEQTASIEGTTYPLPQPFWVIATQNPVEYHGTYPLPEAQLDRFAVQLSMGYPDADEERKILSMHDDHEPLNDLLPVVSITELLQAQAAVRATHVDESLQQYIIAIVRETRQHHQLHLGVSPRGSILFYRMAQAHARMDEREYVLPDDIKAVAIETLAHRLVLDTKARYAGISKEDLVREILDAVPVPH